MVRGAYMSLQRSAPLRAHRRRRRRVRACSGPVVEAAPSGHRPEGAGRRVRRRPLSTTLATLRSLPRWSLVALIVIVAAGGALRFHAAAHPNGHQSEDEQAYAKIARSLVFHKTYGTRDQVDAVHWPPGAPVMFAIAHRLNPKPRPEGRWDVPGAYAWQAAVGTLTILAAFWLALLLILLFATQFPAWGLPGLPVNGMRDLRGDSGLFDRLEHMVLPVASLALVQIAGWTRFIRSSMLETIRQDFVRTAYAKGLPRRIVLYVHAFRNALLPLVTLVGLAIPELFGGAYLIEQIFAWNGAGRLTFQAAQSNDYPLIMGATLMFAVLTMVGNLLADILYAVLDPRIRYD